MYSSRFADSREFYCCSQLLDHEIVITVDCSSAAVKWCSVVFTLCFLIESQPVTSFFKITLLGVLTQQQDVQYARAITEDIPNTYYSVGGSPPWLGTGTNTNEPYLEFLNYLLALPTASLPNMLSISYGDDEDTVPLYYADEVCSLFAQLGARGVSVLVASGDSGVGTTCTSGSTKTFTTSFPASCPWVTVVGGITGNSPESSWTGSGGGFSSIFGVPSYQNATVQKWLTTDTTHTAVNSYFNASGRAYPDVSAQSTDFVIAVGGSFELVDGTSCATPTFASIVQLLSSDRLSLGKPPLGFLNPWLYANATSGLTDITNGSNSGCSGVISGAGFSAVAVCYFLETCCTSIELTIM